MLPRILNGGKGLVQSGLDGTAGCEKPATASAAKQDKRASIVETIVTHWRQHGCRKAAKNRSDHWRFRRHRRGTGQSLRCPRVRSGSRCQERREVAQSG